MRLNIYKRGNQELYGLPESNDNRMLIKGGRKGRYTDCAGKVRGGKRLYRSGPKGWLRGIDKLMQGDLITGRRKGKVCTGKLRGPKVIQIEWFKVLIFILFPSSCLCPICSWSFGVREGN